MITRSQIREKSNKKSDNQASNNKSDKLTKLTL